LIFEHGAEIKDEALVFNSRDYRKTACAAAEAVLD
jgi:hypothetical protein